MSLLKSCRNLLTTLTGVLILTIVSAFGVLAQDSWAANPLLMAANTADTQVEQVNMSLKGKPKAVPNILKAKPRK